MLSDSSFDDDEIEMIAAVAIAKRRHKKSGRCGSIKGHATIWRDRLAGHDRLFHDYFSENSTYPPDKISKEVSNESLSIKLSVYPFTYFDYQICTYMIIKSNNQFNSIKRKQQEE